MTKRKPVSPLDCDAKTIRRMLIVIEDSGFPVQKSVETRFGRKFYRVKG